MLPGTLSPKKNMKHTRKPITIQDVARTAGVSVSTVSRVLNGKVDVAEETTQKVKAVIKQLGYTSSLAARGMRSHRTNVIGMIIPDVASPYCHEIMRGVNQAIAQLDQDLLIYTSGSWDAKLDKELRGKIGGGADIENVAHYERSHVTLLNGGITDGVIVVTPTSTYFSTPAPLVIIDPNNETPDFPAVISTNHKGAISAMSYLTGLGHRRIGCITGRLTLASAKQRFQGYKDGLAAAGIPEDEELVAIGDYTIEVALTCARKLLSLADRPTAIFAANDMSATGVYQVAREFGLEIPGDLSVIGFDNLPEATYLNPPLTTIDQFIEKMGTVATEMLMQLVKGESFPTKSAEGDNLCVIPTELVIRNSCSPIS
ncbi:MAG: LacI family DNA-binding transcriptional regulator [Chloroflexota bacterium]